MRVLRGVLSFYSNISIGWSHQIGDLRGIRTGRRVSDVFLFTDAGLILFSNRRLRIMMAKSIKSYS